MCTDSRQGRSGVSLRGSCPNTVQARQLEQAMEKLQQVTSRHLEALRYSGQRAFLEADARAQAAKSTLHWCGLPENVLATLRESGLALLQQLGPAAATHQGPAELLS